MRLPDDLLPDFRSRPLGNRVGSLKPEPENTKPSLEEMLGTRLKSQQLLLARYVKLCTKANQDKPPIELQELHEFCCHINDYLSHWHFEVILKLEDLDHQAVQSLINQPYSRELIRENDILLDFSDKYARQIDFHDLTRDLEKVGLSLLERINAEDKFINAYQDNSKKKDLTKPYKASPF